MQFRKLSQQVSRALLGAGAVIAFCSTIAFVGTAQQTSSSGYTVPRTPWGVFATPREED